MNQKPITNDVLYVCKDERTQADILNQFRPAAEKCPACRGEWWRYVAEGKKWRGYVCPSDDCKQNQKGQRP